MPVHDGKLFLGKLAFASEHAMSVHVITSTVVRELCPALLWHGLPRLHHQPLHLTSGARTAFEVTHRRYQYRGATSKRPRLTCTGSRLVRRPVLTLCAEHIHTKRTINETSNRN